MSEGLSTKEAVLAESSVSTGQDGPSAAVAALARNSATATVGGVLSQALKVLVLIYIARAYGAAEFGSFSFAYSINAFLYVFAQFGLPTFAAREVAQTSRLNQRLFRSVSEARLLLAIGGGVVALAVLSAVPRVTREELYLVAGFGLSNVALAWMSDWVFQGMGKLHGWAALNIIWQASALVLTVLAVRSRASIWVVSFAYAAGALVAALSGWLWWRRSLGAQENRAGSQYSLTNVLREGTHLGTGTLLQTFLVWIDIIVVRMVLGQHGAGLYAAGNRIALGLGMLAGYYMQGAFPSLTRAALLGPAEYKRNFQQAYNNLSSLFVPGAVWGIFYAPEILEFLYKRSEYSVAAPVFQIFQLVLLLTTFGIVLYGLGVLLAFRWDRTYQRDFAAASTIYLLLSPLLTWRWGIAGAAAAALIVQAILFALFEMQVRRFIVPRHAEALLQPCLLGLAAASLSKLFHVSLFPALSFLTVAYGILGARYLRVMSLRAVTEPNAQMR